MSHDRTRTASLSEYGRPVSINRGISALRIVLAFAIVALLVTSSGCGTTSTASVTARGSVPPLVDALVAAGRPLYDANCASCHGLDGEGEPDWKTPRADGSYRPPPHDASGHTWHHSDRVLIELIAEGSDFAQSRMPAFDSILDDGQIIAILEYIKTWWGPEERDFQWGVSQQDA